MARSDWFRGLATKIGIFVAFIIAAVAIGWGWNYGLRHERIYEQEARQGYSDQSENGCYQIAQPQMQGSSVGQTNRKPCAPSEEAKQDNDSRRNYADLVAQRSSALWAKIMGIAALIGMGLSGVGVILVWITFRETRKANDIAGDIGFKQLRAYVTVENAIQSDVSFTGDNNGFLPVCLTLHNSGSTPATDVRVNLRKHVVIERKAAHIEETFTSPDIGGQARQNIDLPWYNWDEFYYADDPNPLLIGGEIKYKTAIPDDEGQFLEFSTNFSIKPTDTNRRKILEVDIVRMPHRNSF